MITNRLAFSLFQGWERLDTILDAVYITDIFLKFFTAYYEQETNELITANRKIMKNYFRFVNLRNLALTIYSTTR